MISADRIFKYCSLQLEEAKLCQFPNFSNSIGEIQFINFSFKMFPTHSAMYLFMCYLVRR